VLFSVAGDLPPFPDPPTPHHGAGDEEPEGHAQQGQAGGVGRGRDDIGQHEARPLLSIAAKPWPGSVSSTTFARGVGGR